MATISKIKIGNTTYDVKDSLAVRKSSYDGGTVMANQTPNTFCFIYMPNQTADYITDRPDGTDFSGHFGYLTTLLQIGTTAGTKNPIEQILFYPYGNAVYMRHIYLDTVRDWIKFSSDDRSLTQSKYYDGATLSDQPVNTFCMVHPDSSILSEITDAPNGVDLINHYGYLTTLLSDHPSGSGSQPVQQALYYPYGNSLYYRHIYSGGGVRPWSMISGSTVAGKTLSILGASISTFKGHVSPGNSSYYPREGCDVTAVTDTWWRKGADALGLRIIANNSYSGRCCSNVYDSTTPGAWQQAEIDKLSVNGEVPDIVIIQHVGYNDYHRGATLGTYDGTTVLEECPEEGFSDVSRSLATIIKRIQTTYPMTKIYCTTKAQFPRNANFPQITNGVSVAESNARIRQIALAFGCGIIEDANCGLNWFNAEETLCDGSLHPNKLGMNMMANSMIEAIDPGLRIRF